jgi:hypothetical protein
MINTTWLWNAYACYEWWWLPVNADTYDQENVCFGNTVCYVRKDRAREITAAALSWYTFDHWEFTDAFWCCRCVSWDSVCLVIYWNEND